MKYRHAAHAGNFADVVKHAVLALLIEGLKEEDTAFRVIDTHAGAGIYDLTGDEASRSNGWRQGVGRLYSRTLDPSLVALLEPYLAVVEAANNGDRLTYYPGSPWISRALLREQDGLTAVERDPQDAAELRDLFAGDHQVKAIALDGWLALGSFVPPRERRGLILVDPRFDDRDDFDKLIGGLIAAHRRWPTGIYVLSYPVRDLVAIDGFRANLAAKGIRHLIRAELLVRNRAAFGRCNGIGLVICNPPRQFLETLDALFTGLWPHLADGPGAGPVIDIISAEQLHPS